MSFRSDRRFQIWDFNVSHRQLLLRSPAAPGVPGNVDIVFWGVEFLGLPTSLEGVEFVPALPDDLASFGGIPGQVPGSSRVHALCSGGRRFLVVAEGYRIFRNDLDIFESTLQTLGPTRVGASGEILVGS
jgi:hypothetical protein